MEPTNLTCVKCGKSWKLIKAGTAPVTCPHCKASLTAGAAEAKSDPPATASAPAATAPISVPEIASPDKPPLTGLTPLALPETVDTDDPALQADFDDRPEKAGRPGANPLLRVVIILLLVFIGLPVAVFILFLVVCAIIVAAA
jgi:hypothetical protein